MWEQGKSWDCMDFRNENTPIRAWTAHFRVYLFHWLQISSISPRWLLMYQIKFHIKLNLESKVSNVLSYLAFILSPFGFMANTLYWISQSSWNFVLSCYILRVVSLRDWQLRDIFSWFLTRSLFLCRIKNLWRVLEGFKIAQNCRPAGCTYWKWSWSLFHFHNVLSRSTVAPQKVHCLCYCLRTMGFKISYIMKVLGTSQGDNLLWFSIHLWNFC